MPPNTQEVLHKALAALPDPPPMAGLILRPISGGDINIAYQVLTKDNRRWFCKFNDIAHFPDLFVKEARGLALLAQPAILRVPLTIACTTLDERQVLVLEWIHQTPPTGNFWATFGERLARLHRASPVTFSRSNTVGPRSVTQPQFGLDEDNYMGALPQDNTPDDSWPDFFVERRLEPQLLKAYNSGLLNNTAREHFRRLYRHLPDFFPPEPPALLHGDLWSGNFLCDDNNQPVLIDPATYFGHRSMDLAMTTLFGGFDPAFYETYHNSYPLPPNYRGQWEIANLYPLLIHLNLFGEAYKPNILQIIQRF
jgi:fructosamine-3-kinase